MESNSLRQQIANMRQSFFDEGMLDQFFAQIEELENRDENFVEEVITTFFQDTTTLLSKIEQQLEATPIDSASLDRNLHKLKGSSASIGAKKFTTEVIQVRELCQQDDMESAKAAFQKVKTEHATLKDKLDAYFQLLRQAGSAHTGVQPK